MCIQCCSQGRLIDNSCQKAYFWPIRDRSSFDSRRPQQEVHRQNHWVLQWQTRLSGTVRLHHGSQRIRNRSRPTAPKHCFLRVLLQGMHSSKVWKWTWYHVPSTYPDWILWRRRHDYLYGEVQRAVHLKGKTDRWTAAFSAQVSPCYQLQVWTGA